MTIDFRPQKRVDYFQVLQIDNKINKKEGNEKWNYWRKLNLR